METCMQLLAHFPHGYTDHKIAGTCVACKEQLPHILRLLPILRSGCEDPCSLWHRRLSGSVPISCLCHNYWSSHTILYRVYSQCMCIPWIPCHCKWTGRRKEHDCRSLIVYTLRKGEKIQLILFADVQGRKGLRFWIRVQTQAVKKNKFH